MSLEYLPAELFDLICAPFSKYDYLSLCLVSKRCHFFSRKHLYRSVYLTIAAPWFQASDNSRAAITAMSDKEEEDQTKVLSWQHICDCFFRTFRQYPSLASHIRNLGLALNLDELDGSGGGGFHDVVSLLRAAVNVSHLRLSSTKGQSFRHLPSSFIDAVPKGIRSLHLAHAQLEGANLTQLLRHSEGLREFELSLSALSEVPVTSVVLGATPEVLRIRFTRGGSRSTIASAAAPNAPSPFPTTLRIPAAGLSFASLSTLTRLKLLDPPASAIPVGLQACISLKLLAIEWSMRPLQYAHERMPELTPLDDLPPSLVILSLTAVRLKPAEVLRYLNRPTTRLKAMIIFRLIDQAQALSTHGMYEEALEDQIEEMCKFRGIRLRWAGWGFWDSLRLKGATVLRLDDFVLPYSQPGDTFIRY